jgi:hypothetical protein
MGMVSAKVITDLPARVLLAPGFGAVGDGEEAGLHHERDAEHGLEVGLVPARERPTAVGGLHLGGGDDAGGATGVGERGPVPAAELVVERAGEGEMEVQPTRGQLVLRAEVESLQLVVERRPPRPAPGHRRDAPAHR